MPSVRLLLGSNLGDRGRLLHTARVLIGQRVGAIIELTSELETEPWGYDSINSYLNQVVVVETELRPLDVLDVTQQIERFMGRVPRSGSTYEDRPIDIDLLHYHDIGDATYEGLVMVSDRLKLPHPEISNRDFVLTLLSMLSI